MCLVYLLLHHHLKIVKLATQQTIAVAEFEDLRDTWDYLFDAVDNRVWNLVDVWRQQRLDVKIQVETFARGLFEDWWKRVSRTSFGSKQGISNLTCAVARGRIQR